MGRKAYSEHEEEKEKKGGKKEERVRRMREKRWERRVKRRGWQQRAEQKRRRGGEGFGVLAARVLAKKEQNCTRVPWFSLVSAMTLGTLMPAPQTTGSALNLKTARKERNRGGKGEKSWGLLGKAHSVRLGLRVHRGCIQHDSNATFNPRLTKHLEQQQGHDLVIGANQIKLNGRHTQCPSPQRHTRTHLVPTLSNQIGWTLTESNQSQTSHKNNKPTGHVLQPLSWRKFCPRNLY